MQLKVVDQVRESAQDEEQYPNPQVHRQWVLHTLGVAGTLVGALVGAVGGFFCSVIHSFVIHEGSYQR
jgi:hypothetical protein